MFFLVQVPIRVSFEAIVSSYKKDLSKVQKFDWSVPPQNLINLDQIITGVVNCEHPKYFSMEIPANL